MARERAEQQEWTARVRPEVEVAQGYAVDTVKIYFSKQHIGDLFPAYIQVKLPPHTDPIGWIPPNDVPLGIRTLEQIPDTDGDRTMVIDSLITAGHVADEIDTLMEMEGLSEIDAGALVASFINEYIREEDTERVHSSPLNTLSNRRGTRLSQALLAAFILYRVGFGESVRVYSFTDYAQPEPGPNYAIAYGDFTGLPADPIGMSKDEWLVIDGRQRALLVLNSDTNGPAGGDIVRRLSRAEPMYRF